MIVWPAMNVRPGWRWCSGFAAAFLAVCFAAAAPAEDDAVIVRVEEDWELVVQTPDANSHGPQVSCAISPIGNVDGVYGVFVVNHRSLPAFAGGGLQLQVWNDESPVSHRKFPNDAQMTQAGETVRWTQSMQLGDGLLEFEVTNGNSTTWGDFGGQGYLRITVTTDLANLDSYNPTVSVKNSGVGYAANRVQSLVLKRVRLVTSDGEVLEDDTARVVHQQE